MLDFFIEAGLEVQLRRGEVGLDHGPIGQKVSNPLPRVTLLIPGLEVAAVTSLRKYAEHMLEGFFFKDVLRDIFDKRRRVRPHNRLAGRGRVDDAVIRTR